MLEFSPIAKEYAAFRPRYPHDLVEGILTYAKKTTPLKTAWDAATGNFQMANAIAPHFDTVFANDVSAEQLRAGVPAGNVIAIQCESENMHELSDRSANLVTCAQAIHWFNIPDFITEVQRVLVPGGVIALPGYSRPQAADPETDKILQNHMDRMKPYRDPRLALRITDDGAIPFPFTDRTVRNFTATFNATAEQIVGYLSSSEMVTRAIADTGANPLPIVEAALHDRLQGAPAQMTQPFFCVMGRSI